MKILLIDDHALFRDGFSLLIRSMSTDYEVECVGTGGLGLAAVADHPEIDLILLDYKLPDGNGIEFLQKLREQSPSTPVVLLSAEENSALIQTALSQGASGFIPKSASAEVMLSAVKLVLAGGVYVPQMALNNANGLSESDLTDRQIEVLREMAKGLSNKEIARVLDMSPATVKVHVAAILSRLKVKNRTQAVTIAREAGYCY
jgi:two-component system nitrate/nitrite response regulator NarL